MSQPDPKDGPPQVNAFDLAAWKRKLDEWASNAENAAIAAFCEALGLEPAEWEKEHPANQRKWRAVAAAALRVVPPEGGPRPDELIAEIVRGFFQGCDASITKSVTRFQVGQILRQYEVRRAAVLRASGAGTRQEEPPEPITKEHLDVAMKAADADYQQTADWPMDAQHSDDLRRRSAMFAALTAVWDTLHVAESRPNE